MSIKNFIGLLFYDISIETAEDKKRYTKFRDEILKRGYYQLQESVYICRYNYKEKSEDDVCYFREIAPLKSNIRFLLLTKQQYKMMRVINGNENFIEKILLLDKPIINL